MQTPAPVEYVQPQDRPHQICRAAQLWRFLVKNGHVPASKLALALLVIGRGVR
jgi:hypothetical protein